MKEIRLYGALGEQFGRVHQFDVQSPAEAVRALSTVIPGFKEYLVQHRDKWFKVWSGATSNSKDTLSIPCSDKEVIRIVPVVGGASGLGQMVLGAALIWAGSSFGQPWMVSMGWGMVFGGAVSLLTTHPRAPSPDDQAGTPNYAFNGPVNTIYQGNPAPVAYGTVLAGSQVISTTTSAENSWAKPVAMDDFLQSWNLSDIVGDAHVPPPYGAFWLLGQTNNVLNNDSTPSTIPLVVSSFVYNGNSYAPGTQVAVVGGLGSTLSIAANGAASLTVAGGWGGGAAQLTYTATDGRYSTSASCTMVVSAANEPSYGS